MHTQSVLIGRDDERAAIDRLLDAAGSGRSGALVIRGEAGAGKTALLEHAVASAGAARVARALGVEPESAFAFAGLHELVRPLLDRLDDLPRVQADALRGALALAEPQNVGRLYVGAATLSLLAAAGGDGPLLCVVDDAHWLDDASADALTFAARRLDAEGVVMLFAARTGAERAFPAAGVPELVLSGLSPDAAAALLEAHAGAPVAPPVAADLARATHGNPLALVDLAHRLSRGQLAGVEPLPHPLPVGPGLKAAFAAGMTRLSQSAQRALVVAATADTRAMRVITRADAAMRAGLEECEEAGFVEIGGGQIDFSHPLLRSSVYQQASPADRRRAHRALAEAFAVDARYAERRAWHAASAATGPEEETAAELERAGEAARARRGHVAAAAMFERAAHLTLDAEPRARRLVLAAHSAWLAGQAERALRLLDETTPGDDVVRADIAYLRARIAPDDTAASRLVAEATRVEALDPSRAAALLAAAAELAAPAERLDLARRAVAVADDRGDSGGLLASLALARAAAGEEARAALARAQTMLAGDLRSDPELIVAVVEAVAAVDPGDEESVRELIDEGIAAARTHAVAVLPRALVQGAWLAFAGGRWTDAYVAFVEAARLADEAGRPRDRVAALAGRGVLDALQGRDADGEAAAAGVPARAAARVLGLLALGRGDPGAVGHLAEAAADPAPGLFPRGLPPCELDLLEALLRVGEREKALAVAAAIPPTDPAADWAAALLGGDRTAFMTAAGRLAARPFVLARVRLDHGEAARRAGERREARAQLEAALDTFAALGAAPWEERTRSELRASGASPRRREPTTLDPLTPQELQVARAVAAEASYKDAAAKLFLSPKTVEYHLHKVYRKLGITSGRQLARRLAEEGLIEGP